MALEEEWMKLGDEAPASQPVRTFARRSKIIRLDDLVSANAKEKLEKAKQKHRAAESSSDEDEDDHNEGEANAELAKFINKCAVEVGDGQDMTDAPKWGEKVSGAQKEVQVLGFSSSDSEAVRLLITAANSKPECYAPVDGTENDLMDDILAGDWVTTLVRHRLDQPDFLRCIFNRMLFSPNKNVQEGACTALCDYFLEHKDPPCWKPTVTEIQEALNWYCYQAQPGDAGDHNRPSWLLKVLLVLCKLRLFQDSEAEDLVPVLARCSFNRGLLRQINPIQECIEELVNQLSPSSLQKISSSLARLTTDLVNIYHVLKLLRGVLTKVEPLRKEAAFELLSNMTTKKLNRCVNDVILSLEDYDPKVSDVDFVRVFYHINLANIYLFQDPELKPDDEAFASWMQILRSFAVRIFCGDYRTFANELRNRAAFLMSVYGMRTHPAV